MLARIEIEPIKMIPSMVPQWCNLQYIGVVGPGDGAGLLVHHPGPGHCLPLRLLHEEPHQQGGCEAGQQQPGGGDQLSPRLPDGLHCCRGFPCDDEGFQGARSAGLLARHQLQRHPDPQGGHRAGSQDHHGTHRAGQTGTVRNLLGIILISQTQSQQRL